MATHADVAAATDDGIVTVVFVDVEGSTALVDRLGDHGGIGAVSRQLDQVRERITSYGGREVKSLGDGFLVVFSSPRQAVAFGLAVQRALVGSQPRLRIGINAGEVIDRHADPLGAAVNAAARIVARAEGGEVLVSDVVRQLVGRVPTIEFVDRGRVRLKGFSERWRLWAAQDTTSTRPQRTTVGRTHEQIALRELVASAATGAGGAVILEGEPGIGKSHLIRDALDLAAAAGVPVVQAAGDEMIRRPGALSEAIVAAPAVPSPLSDALRSALRVSPPEGDTTDRSFLVVDASVDALEAMARTAPVLVVFDDGQWADELSLALLRALAARTATASFAIVVAIRPTPRARSLDRVVDAVVDGGGRHIRLAPLEEVDVHALSTVVTGAAPGDLLRAQLRATGGNPLFAIELLRSLDEEGEMRIEGGIAEVAGTSMPSGLGDTLVRRLSWLPPESLDLLRLASLLGTSFTLAELATMTQRSVLEIAAGLRDASLAGLIIGESDRLAFRHDVVREAVYEHMLPAERRDLHRAAGAAFAAAGAPLQQIAMQFGRGALRGDLEAVGWLQRAGDENAGFAPTAAVDDYRLALQLAPEPWPERAQLMVKLIEPLAACGRFDEAEQIAAEVLATNPPDDVVVRACRGLGAVHGNRGDMAQAMTMLERAAATPGAPPLEAATLRCMVVQLSVVTGALDADEGTRRAERTLDHGVEADDLDLQCTAHQALGCITSLDGHGAAALDHFLTATALLDSGRVTPNSYLIPDLFAAAELGELDRIDEAIARSARARERLTARGVLSQLPMAYGISAWALANVGQYDDAVAELDAAVALSQDTGTYTFLLYFDALRASIALRRGDVAGAQAVIATGFERLAADPARFGVDLLADSNVQVLLAAGDLDGALVLAEAVWQQTASIRLYYGARDRTLTMMHVATRAGRRDLATEATETMELAAERRPCPSTRAVAMHCRGMLEEDAASMLDALAELRQTPLRPVLARCCEHTAEVLATSDRDGAVALLDEAASIYVALGASGDLARVDAALEAIGGRPRRARPRRPTFGWESLTPTELTVSGHVAQGLTNPEIATQLFISRRTVESHLAHIFRKLEIGGRAQLAVEVTRRT